MSKGWSISDLRRLEELCKAGWTYSAIGSDLGRSRASVHLKAGRLNLSNGLPLGGRPGNKGSSGEGGKRALLNGTAAELIACADLILAGERAFLSSAGYSYDLVADISGRLLRVGVTACLKPTARPEREGGRVCYQFSLMKNGTGRERYSSDHCEAFALVALDIRKVLYIMPRNGFFPTSFHVDPPAVDKRAPSRNGVIRKQWLHFMDAKDFAAEVRK